MSLSKIIEAAAPLLPYIVPPIVTAFLGWIVQSPIGKKLPKSWRAWADRVADEDIVKLIVQANELKELTPVQRRAWVVEELKEQSRKKWGDSPRTSIANGIVELAYEKWLKEQEQKK